MTPSPVLRYPHVDIRSRAPLEPWSGEDTREQIVEAWGQGFNVGALVIIILIVLCNYRKNVLLHKLILLELLLAVWHGIFIFFTTPVYGWLLSSTAIPLYVSYTLHNVVAWIKIKPFLPRWGGRFFIVSLLLVQPYWVVETWANFEYFNATNYDVFETTRYLEPLMRDPWWIFTTVKLVLVINKNYDYTIRSLIKKSPRFGVLLLCMFISIIFLLTDIFVTAFYSVQSGINPYWRLALVFKCASDAIFLDDFKSVLDRISESALRYVANLPNGSRQRNGSHTNSSSHRRTSSIPFRKPSGSRFPGFNYPWHDTQISTNNVPGHQMAEQGPKPTRDEWLEFRSMQGQKLDRSVEEDSTDSQPGILAQTTITIDEHDDDMDKIQGSTAHARLGSQDRILPNNNLLPPDYGWGEPPTSRDDVETGIPMAPMRARTNSERNVRFG